MPKQLRDLTVHEVSGVDAAANRRRFLLAKSAGKTPPPDVLKGAIPMAKSPTEIMKALAGALGLTVKVEKSATVSVDDVMCKLSDGIDAVLDAEGVAKREAITALVAEFAKALEVPDVKKAFGEDESADVLKSLEEVLAKAVKPDAADAEDGDDPDEDAEEKARKKKDRERKRAEREKAKQDEDVTMSKSDDVIALTKRVDAQAADLKKAQDEVRKERELRLDAEYLQKAKDLGPVPGMTFSEVAGLLKSATPEHAKLMEKQFRASAELVRKSGVFEEFGSGGVGSGTDDAEGRFIAKAEEIVKRDKIGLADAMTKASKESPEVHAEYVMAQRRRGR